MRTPFNGLTVSDCQEVVANITECSAVQFRTFLQSCEIIFLTSQCQDHVSGAGLSPRQDGGVHRQHGELGGGDDGGLLQREKEN